MGANLDCPQCRAPILGSGTGRPSIGRPFDECPRCQTFVPRSHCNEWDFLSFPEQALHLWRAARIALGFGAVAGLSYGTYTLLAPVAFEPRIALGLLAAGVVGLSVWSGSRLFSAIRRSRHRLTDPMYRSKLVQFGISGETRAR